MTGTREAAQQFIDQGSWVVSYTDKVNSTTGATPENGISPYPGYRPPRTSAAAQVTSPDVNSIIADATPSAPASDLMRIINSVGAVNQGLQDELITTREHNVGLSVRNRWLEDRNTWLEKCSDLGRKEIDRLQGRIHEQAAEIEQQRYVIRQGERIVAGLYASQLATSSAVQGLTPQVNVIKQSLAQLGGAQRGGEGEMEEEAQYVNAPTRPARIKLKGPACPVSEDKQVCGDERKDVPVAGPSTGIRKLNRVEVDSDEAVQKADRLNSYRAIVHDMYIRDDTPECYSKA